MNKNAFYDENGLRVGRPTTPPTILEALQKDYFGGIFQNTDAAQVATLHHLSTATKDAANDTHNDLAWVRIPVQSVYVADGFSGTGMHPKYYVNPKLKSFENLRTGIARALIPFTNSIYGSIQKWFNSITEDYNQHGCLVIYGLGNAMNAKTFEAYALAMIKDALLDVLGDDSADEVISSVYDVNTNEVIYNLRGFGSNARLMVHFINPAPYAYATNPKVADLDKVQNYPPARGFDYWDAITFGTNDFNEPCHTVLKADGMPIAVTAPQNIVPTDGSVVYTLEDCMTRYLAVRNIVKTHYSGIIAGNPADWGDVDPIIKSLYTIPVSAIYQHIDLTYNMGDVHYNTAAKTQFNILAKAILDQTLTGSQNIIDLDEKLWALMQSMGGRLVFPTTPNTSIALTPGAFKTTTMTALGGTFEYLMAIRTREAALGGSDSLDKFLKKYNPTGVLTNALHGLPRDVFYCKSSYGFAHTFVKKANESVRKLISYHALYDMDTAAGLYSSYPFLNASKTARYVI